MQTITFQRLVALAAALGLGTLALSQDVGSSRGGLAAPQPGVPDREAVGEYIEVQGSAQLGVAGFVSCWVPSGSRAMGPSIVGSSGRGSPALKR